MTVLAATSSWGSAGLVWAGIRRRVLCWHRPAVGQAGAEDRLGWPVTPDPEGAPWEGLMGTGA